MKKLLLSFVLVAFYIFLYKIYIPRVNAFGCFDDCFTFSAGYFLSKGKILYSQIFYNHQLLPAYLSLLIQIFFHPQNLFELVLRHRQALFVFSLIFNFFLVWRFSFPAFLFSVFYEISKFYIFGDRFLGEGILVYPLVFLLFISWEKFKKIKVNSRDLIISSICAWSIIFLREAFIPIALVLFAYLLTPLKKFNKKKLLPVAIVLLLSLITLATVNPTDYFFQLFTVNKSFFSSEPDLLKSLFYPIEILVRDKLNLFNFLLLGIDFMFLFSILFLLLKKEWKMLLVLIPLFLTNLRVVDPGRIFYDSFHMIPFYATFLAITFILIFEIKKHNKNIWKFLLVFTGILFLFYVSSPRVFFKEKINEHQEFITNYGNILQAGLVFKNLSNHNDTLFLDGYDEVIYWEANLPSSYKYSMYTSLMPEFPIYSGGRIKMFQNNPPIFYYGSCPKESNPGRLLPEGVRSFYVRLNSFGKPSCIFVKKDKLPRISDKQWQKVEELGFEKPLILDR